MGIIRYVTHSLMIELVRPAAIVKSEDSLGHCFRALLRPVQGTVSNAHWSAQRHGYQRRAKLVRLHTRYAMSFMRGPLTPGELRQLRGG